MQGRLIGKKDIKGTEIREGDVYTTQSKEPTVNFDVIKYGEHPTAKGVIMGYFVPDGCEVLSGKRNKK